ncbi:hypothetical protein BRARA_J00909 [Brassica rapa]|uniref:DUF4408 domain-containing protein n=2 Tax=Brassica TaxID=3705 RepID=A0ABQ8BNP8_BRANA|nr:uncharacterized protein LOC125579147 isoform X2 [Brassica napus]KAH0906435.1 hypothetical protein HID58_038262 [Brassica napus]RID40903.1 hypothetical protein BRARA_J00909 [Brassica rapa]
MRSLTMPILLPTSSFKKTATVIIAGVFSLAAAVSFTVPSVSHVMASCFLIFYDNTVFLVKPPYLYLVTNCIIVSIVATSKLTQKASAHIDDPEFSDVVTPETLEPVPSDIDAGYLNVAHVVSYTGVEENDAPVEDVSEVNSDDNVIVDSQQDQHAETEKPKPSSASPEQESKEPKPKSDSPAVSVVKPLRKPPRFSQQRSLKNIEEGGGGSKKSKGSRREDTLETTWRKITEERSTPLKKHLTKSDTWHERSHVQKKEKMTKSDNLYEAEETLKLKREPSPGQEELNRRVEAFIKKFNEEMRLQRLESLAKYNEMVNGGPRL